MCKKGYLRIRQTGKSGRKDKLMTQLSITDNHVVFSFIPLMKQDVSLERSANRYHRFRSFPFIILLKKKLHSALSSVIV